MPRARQSLLLGAVCAGLLLWQTAGSVGQLPPGIVIAPPVDPQSQAAVDQAIQRGLHYLAQQQQGNGAWSSERMGDSPACTSLAIMAFLAAGHLPDEGPYAANLSRGIQFVLLQQSGEGFFADRHTHGPMYTHGICTLMLAEVLGTTPASEATRVRHALEKAIRLILEAQDQPKDRDNTGGWRYSPTSNDSDLSVTGWQLLALRAAKNVGCDIPADYIDRAVAYVKRCSVQNGGFAYQPYGGPTAVRTGTGILCLEICGDHHSAEALQGGAYLLRQPLMVQERFFYYCSIGMFQLGEDYWPAMRSHLHRIVLPLQEADGAWLVPPGEEGGAGPVYCTSLAILALAVEYQYLPIYQR